MKGRDTLYYVQEIGRAIEEVAELPKPQQEEQIKEIYRHFYDKRKVELLANVRALSEVKQKESQLLESTKNQQLKIIAELQDRKKYIMANFSLLKDYNERALEEINLNLLQVQAQNYNLIAECNTRKEQTGKKKKMLHELIDPVKETQIYLDEMKREGPEGPTNLRTPATL